MTELPDDPRRFAAKRVAKLYHKGVTGTVIEFADVFLRKLPWRWLVLVVVAGGASFLKFTAVPYLTSLAVTDWSERHGVQIEVGEWQADLWNLRVRAANLELKATDSFSRNNLLEASAVDLDFGARYHLTQFLWGKPLWDLLRLDLSSYGLSKVVLDHAVVHVERGMSGHGNWDTTLAHLDLGLDESASAAVSQPNVRTVALIEATTAPANEPSDWPSFKPRTVEIRGLKIEWIENLPGGSGGGLIRNVQETLYVDDVDVVAHGDYAGDTGELKQLDFNLEGRTADGRLSITGAWTPARETALSFRTVLENVGAHAFARMVPDPALVAVSGSMNGNIDLSLVNAQWRCQGDLTLQNVAYQPVFDSYVARKNSDALQTGLRDFRANRRVEFDCNSLGNQQGFGLVSYLQTTTTAAAVQDAPKVVQAVAKVEVARTGAGVAGEDDVKTFIQKVVTEKIGDESLANALTETTLNEAVTRLPVQAQGVASLTLGQAKAGTRQAGAKQPAPAQPQAHGIKGFAQSIKNFFTH